jgi:hypothetical protein
MTTEGRRKSRSSSVNSIVMAGLDPAIHVFIARKRKQDVDHWDKPGDDPMGVEADGRRIRLCSQ